MSAAKNSVPTLNEAYARAEEIRRTGNLELLRENIHLVSNMPDMYVSNLYRAIGQKLGITRAEYDEMILSARADHIPSEDGRPVVRVGGRLLDEMTADVLDAICDANQPAVRFRRGGALVSISRDDSGAAILRRYDPISIRSDVARVAIFETHRQNGRAVKCPPPMEVVNDVLVMAATDPRIPLLKAITATPVLHSDGSLHTTPGYDPAGEVYYQAEPGFNLGDIPETPTPEDARRAAEYLYREMLGEFPYEGEADRANALGALVTAILRPEMKTPLAAFDAPKGGSGKTLLVSAMSIAANGREPTVSPLPETEPEVRKTITSLLDAGTDLVVFDNADRAVRSAALAAVLTCDAWSDRALGRSENIKVPNRTIWMLTGNNLQMGAEMTRRVYRIRLDAKVAEPQKRTGFTKPDDLLLEWARTHRGDIVAAVLTMAKAWITAGRPRGDVPVLGSFVPWAHMIGGILSFAGVSGFLGNLDQLQAEADEETAEWVEFLTRWVITFQDNEISVADLVAAINNSNSVLHRTTVPDCVGEPEAGSFAKRLGHALRRKAGTRFGERELRVERAGRHAHFKTTLWRVQGNLAGLCDFKPDSEA